MVGSVVQSDANSGVLVFPISTTPARRRRRMYSLSGRGLQCSKNRQEKVVGQFATNRLLSLTRNGTPASGAVRSTFAASASAASSSSNTTALSSGLIVRTVSMAQAATSRGSASPARTRRAISRPSSHRYVSMSIDWPGHLGQVSSRCLFQPAVHGLRIGRKPLVRDLLHVAPLDVGFFGCATHIFRRERELFQNGSCVWHFCYKFLVGKFTDVSGLVAAVPCRVGVGSPGWIGEACILGLGKLHPSAIVFRGEPIGLVAPREDWLFLVHRAGNGGCQRNRRSRGDDLYVYCEGLCAFVHVRCPVSRCVDEPGLGRSFGRRKRLYTVRLLQRFIVRQAWTHRLYVFRIPPALTHRDSCRTEIFYLSGREGVFDRSGGRRPGAGCDREIARDYALEMRSVVDCCKLDIIAGLLEGAAIDGRYEIEVS